ncbi:ankyrin repeat domain-containing protein [Vibrio vulnificus]|uniref:Ankyrin repeat domain-containing protein n=2 Tax=Vibrio vulnificus TaxID=672 RepID=A0ABX4X3W9_VIBVL|nr:ankyrin repeat domain-containing protein [Vibrio vulnificus]EGQ9938217.1 ankyrin repeat domain-containing protein [Vibrio vulnificus]EGR0054349.1 ankyrin repeat domain-containing protein [Vibrio vulnificus]EHU5001305.1 ankyrin repeat domain-containing protein [Vibrio vulnificus]EID4339727.1 ankyrin repeat domain-containing protein [Vibrio vulnificus]EID4377064.1 ankyrin repeat domain-containing protein [Vibrio vulnificus]
MVNWKRLFSATSKVLSVLMIALLSLLSGCKFEGKDMKADLFFDAKMVSLLHAIQRKDSAAAKAMLVQGVELNVRGEEGITPLLWLIMQKDLSAIELALQLGADANFPAMITINREGPKPAQPLAIIAGDGDNQLFSLLLKYGASPDSRDESTGRPAIFGIIGHDSWQQFSLLLEYGVDINAKDRSNSNSALYAADLGKYDFVYKLINEGASATEPSTTGASVAWRVHLALEKNAKNPAFRVSEDTHKTKAMLEERGVVFPPPTPQEVREALKQGQS